MSRFLAIFAALAAVSTPSLAQDLPSPALEGGGQSTQTLDLVKDTVSVTVDSGGSISTRSGEAAGHVSVDANGLGVAIGTSSGPEQAAASGGTARVERSMVSADGTTAGTAAVATGSAAAAAAGDCAMGVALTAAEIASVGTGTRVMLARECPGLAMTAEQRQALTDNVALATFVIGSGVPLDAVTSITILRDVIAVSHRHPD